MGEDHLGRRTDERSFDDFYRAAHRRLVHQLYALTGSTAEAQDCVAEAFARAWQRWPSLRAEGDPEAWVAVVARRVAVSRWRRARTALQHLRRQRDEPVVEAPSEDHAVLVAALRRIPAAQREAIVLHHLSGLPVEEVARQTGVAVGTTKARLSRGRGALAEVLGEPHEPSPPAAHPAPPCAASSRPHRSSGPHREQTPRAR